MKRQTKKEAADGFETAHWDCRDADRYSFEEGWEAYQRERALTVIVTGGRDFKDVALLNSILDAFEIKLLVHGACPSGADLLADQYAKKRGIPRKPYPANWDEFGRAAGPRRNGEMLSFYPEALVIAFPGNRGTQDCIDKAIRRGLRVLEVK